jgi:small subunit ribosomal protein S3
LYEREIALKTIRPELMSPAVLQAFGRERNHLARLEHPAIVALLDAGISADGQPWLAMQRVHGEHIDRWCDAQGADLRSRVALMIEACGAFHHAHANGVLHQDIKLRKAIKQRLNQAGVSRVIIERPHKKCRISIYAARPGVIIGKKGADIEKLRKQLGAMTSSDVSLNIVEIRKPEIDSRLVAQSVADQLERRIAFRRAMKRAVQSALRLGAEGIRITCAGRLGGAEIARTEWYREGRVPLHTLRGNVDYAEAEAHTAYGVCGVKVWIFKGEILGHDPTAQDRLMMEAQTSGVRPAREDRGNR